MKYSFQVIEIDKINIEEYYQFEDKLVFTTVEWLNFIENNQKAEPLIIRITENMNLVGYFTGLIFKKFWIKIIGSPFDGWTTPYMGFNVAENYNREDLIKPLSKFLFNTYKCHFIQITDRFIDENKLKSTKLHYFIKTSLELDIEKPDNELLKGFKRNCRELIRQFEARGATIEETEPDEQFATEYYEQLKEVFAKQNLVPTYNITRVLDLFKCLNKEQLLCLRVRNPEGKSIASTYFVGYNKRVCFQGAASFREFQFYRPNEYMVWYAIKYYRDKGYKYFDLNGERHYKNKYNPEKISYPCIIITKYPILIRLRSLAKKFVWLLFKIKGFRKKKNVPDTKIYKKEEKE
ncbi:MAG: GNAT family N-acetyltransferase [Anaerovoracaceae bacterium]|jgi:hypothetical protein